MILVSCAFFAFPCLSGTIDPSSTDVKHVEYGDGFKCVVQIEGQCGCGNGKPHMFHASAVAISKNCAVTAAHVVVGNKDVKIRIGEKTFNALKVFVHEGFKNEKVGHSDIAICLCEGDFGLDFYPDLYEKTDEVSKVVSMAGYGITGNFSTGGVKSDQRRRAGSNIISRSENDVLICILSDNKTELEFMIAPGDSGGGLFIENKLAGINSFVTADDGKPDSDYGDECAHTRISKFIPWIREKMER
jgi:hypothetical protein